MAIRGKIIVKFKRKRALTSVSDRALGRAYKEVASQIHSEIFRKVSRPYPPASKHGQYPRKRSGDFRDGIAVTGTKNGITISSSEDYGKYLEDGTSRMLPRTWAKRVLMWGNNRQKWEQKIAALARKYTGGSKVRSRR